MKISSWNLKRTLKWAKSWHPTKTYQNNTVQLHGSQVQVVFPRSSASPEVFGHGEGRKKHGDLPRMGSRVWGTSHPRQKTCLQEKKRRFTQRFTNMFPNDALHISTLGGCNKSKPTSLVTISIATLQRLARSKQLNPSSAPSSSRHGRGLFCVARDEQSINVQREADSLYRLLANGWDAMATERIQKDGENKTCNTLYKLNTDCCGEVGLWI